MKEYYCPKCGKEFYPTYNYIYKKDKTYYCSWTCYNQAIYKPKRKIIRPKVGDTIRISSMSPVINGYKNKVGVVEFIDSYGQLFGTWGEMQIIPETDKIEIIKEKETNDEPTETNQ